MIGDTTWYFQDGKMTKEQVTDILFKLGEELEGLSHECMAINI